MRRGKIVEPSNRLKFGRIRNQGGNFGDVVSAADPKVGRKNTGLSEEQMKGRSAAEAYEAKQKKKRAEKAVQDGRAAAEAYEKKQKEKRAAQERAKSTRPEVGKDVGRPNNQGTAKPAPPKPKKKEMSPREKKQNQAQGSGGKDRDGIVKSNNDRKNDNRVGKSGSNARKPGEPERGKRKIDSPSQRIADEYIDGKPAKKKFPVEPKKPVKPKPAPAPKPVPGRGVKPLPVGSGSRPAPSIRIDNRNNNNNTNVNNNSQSQSQSQKQESGSKMKDRRSKVDRIKDRAAKRVGKIEGRQERRAERREKIGAAKSRVVGAIDNVRGKMARRREAVKGAKSEAREQIKKARGKAKNGMMKYKPGGFKPDYLDFDKDGNKNEPMKSALKDRRKGGYGKKKK